MSQIASPTVIIGAGFVGLFTALHLSHKHYAAPIILIDRNDRFCFKPLLYEYFSTELDPNQVVPLYTDLLQGSPVTFVQETVTGVDFAQQRVELASGDSYEYGNLVLALGCVPAFFAPGAAEHTFTFQSKADADALKQHLHTCLRQAVQISDAEARRDLLTTAIVGGGPAGVELALTLGDMLPEWYLAEGGNPSDLRVILLNRGDILQGDVNTLLRDTATQSMEQRRVQPQLLLEASVTGVGPQVIEYTRRGEAAALRAGTIVWTCGTKVHPLIQSLAVPESARSPRGQLLVTSTLHLLDHLNVYAAGDCAVVVQTDGRKAQPATAQVAYQQGAAIAQALLAKASGHAPRIAPVTLRGTLMKLGFGTGVANLFDRYEITGKLGQSIRQMTYLQLLPTPLHNFRAATDWLKDEVFHSHADEQHHIGYTAGYSEDELAVLAAAVVTSALAVSMAEQGAVSTLLESMALKKELAGAPIRYPNNRVILALFGHHSKRDAATQLTISMQPDNALEVAQRYIQQALAILPGRATPEEILEYQDLIYTCCDRVANAAGDGFLGRGAKLSPAEAAVLEQLKRCLDRPTDLQAVSC
jgi:NADH dehydrogenase FAD-containing subunit